ncbi:MAG: acyl-CoA dehydrogenase family protein, partial [Aquabacterium sp.]|nr:acyl-CoA dehydrogenase family protein [Aquabacterium sp.]
MFAEPSARTQDLLDRMRAFFDRHIYPNEARHHEELHQRRQAGTAWEPMTLIEELKPLARQAGLWNLFLPHSHRAPEGLSNLDYAQLCELMGRVMWSAEVFNCTAPDTGNMETIERYGSEAKKDQWLEPLLRGEIRSAFLMTDPDVASSDATNIECSNE